jgi:hypothetical protein
MIYFFGTLKILPKCYQCEEIRKMKGTNHKVEFEDNGQFWIEIDSIIEVDKNFQTPFYGFTHVLKMKCSTRRQMD